MKIALMQPYFIPYLGYFQLIEAVDLFVLHDDVEYSKGGWTNRNRVLLAEGARLVTVSLERASDYALINQRRISESYDCKKMLRILRAAYGKAPHWQWIESRLPDIVCANTRSLLEFNSVGLARVCAALELDTPFVSASEILPNANSSGQQKVIDICRALGALEYVNPVGGMALYSGREFLANGIRLSFLRSRLSPYYQGTNKVFVPALSVLDALAWVGSADTSDLVRSDYDIIRG